MLSFINTPISIIKQGTKCPRTKTTTCLRSFINFLKLIRIKWQPSENVKARSTPGTPLTPAEQVYLVYRTSEKYTH